MANTKSAKKRILVTERNRKRNQALKSAFRTALKKIRAGVTKKAEKETLTTELKNAYSLLDKAVLKGVVHKNTAARYKSNITQLVSKVS